MLICNPNAGYFEFSYFQSDWLEFYLSRDIDVFLWNYRGFGKSTGRPTIENIIEDGKVIVNYLRNERHVAKLGIHGESLGGCIAIHLAEACVCDFLFADRTFGYLTDTIYFNLGRFAYFCFKLSGFKDAESITPYLKLPCFKVLASDPLDKVIPDIASLKCGIASRICHNTYKPVSNYSSKKQLKKLEFLFSNEECERFFEAIRVLSNIWEAKNEIIQSEMYEGIFKTEYNEEEGKAVVCKIMNVVNDLDAGGMPLNTVVQSEYSLIQFKLWLMVLETWGSCRRDLNGQGKIILEGMIEDVKGMNRKNRNVDTQILCEHVDVAIRVLQKCLEYVEEKGGKSGALTVRTEVNNNDIGTFGNLLGLTCGHSGQFNTTEKEMYSNQIILSAFRIVPF